MAQAPPWAWLILGVAYFAPAVIAALRGRRPLLVFVLTAVLGWTVLGWLAALVLALSGGGAGPRARRGGRGDADGAVETTAGVAQTPAFDAFGGECGDGGGGGCD
jgi:hypothetical protein